MLENILLFGQALIMPVARSVAGWAGNALKDDEVTYFEWKELGETTIRIGIIEAAIFFGVNLAGFDIPIIAAGCAAFIADKIFSALKAI